MRSNARRRVRTRSTGVISSSSVRIGLIWSAEPIHAWAAPIRPPLRRYSSVSIANHIFRPSRARSAAARTSVPRAPRSAARRGRERQEAGAAAGRAAVVDEDPLAALALVDQLLARLVRRVAGAGDAGREVDRDDLARRRRGAARRPRGSRRRMAARWSRPRAAPQALVEVVVLGRADLALALLLAVERHVQADPVDPVARDQLVGQVGGRSRRRRRCWRRWRRSLGDQAWYHVSRRIHVLRRRHRSKPVKVIN